MRIKLLLSEQRARPRAISYAVEVKEDASSILYLWVDDRPEHVRPSGLRRSFLLSSLSSQESGMIRLGAFRIKQSNEGVRVGFDLAQSQLESSLSHIDDSTSNILQQADIQGENPGVMGWVTPEGPEGDLSEPEFDDEFSEDLPSIIFEDELPNQIIEESVPRAEGIEPVDNAPEAQDNTTDLISFGINEGASHLVAPQPDHNIEQGTQLIIRRFHHPNGSTQVLQPELVLELSWSDEQRQELGRQRRGPRAIGDALGENQKISAWILPTAMNIMASPLSRVFVQVQKIADRYGIHPAMFLTLLTFGGTALGMGALAFQQSEAKAEAQAQAEEAALAKSRSDDAAVEAISREEQCRVKQIDLLADYGSLDLASSEGALAALAPTLSEIEYRKLRGSPPDSAGGEEKNHRVEILAEWIEDASALREETIPRAAHGFRAQFASTLMPDVPYHGIFWHGLPSARADVDLIIDTPSGEYRGAWGLSERVEVEFGGQGDLTLRDQELWSAKALSDGIRQTRSALLKGSGDRMPAWPEQLNLWSMAILYGYNAMPGDAARSGSSISACVSLLIGDRGVGAIETEPNQPILPGLVSFINGEVSLPQLPSAPACPWNERHLKAGANLALETVVDAYILSEEKAAK